MYYLKINDSDKKKIGYLIHLYRTQQFKHLSQNSFLLKDTFNKTGYRHH